MGVCPPDASVQQGWECSPRWPPRCTWGLAWWRRWRLRRRSACARYAAGAGGGWWDRSSQELTEIPLRFYVLASGPGGGAWLSVRVGTAEDRRRAVCAAVRLGTRRSERSGRRFDACQRRLSGVRCARCYPRRRLTTPAANSHRPWTARARLPWRPRSTRRRGTSTPR
jgi:hypothetical protein